MRSHHDDEKIDRRGFEIIWENNCFLKLSEEGKDYNSKKKKEKKKQNK